MIDDYKGLAVFVAVVEAGSFSAAGRRLRLSTSVVSHHVSRLEDKLGVALFFRSTRSLSLTPEGQGMLPAARAMVASGEEALDALAGAGEQPVGTLRVTMPAFGDRSPTHNAVWAFAAAHPQVSISVHSTDERVDLVRDGFDIGIRLGRLQDSALKSRKVGEFRRALVAAPSYLASRPPIQSVEDLQDCLQVAFAMLPRSMTLLRAGEEVEIVQTNFRLEVNSVISAKAAIVAGLGVLNLPLSEVQEELKTGTLVEVLPDWTPPVMGIFALWPETGTQKRLTRRFIDHLAAAGRATSSVPQSV
ncbi:MAG: LysR family transcriptional regulator [Pseudomonadota bacterium]